MDNELLKEIAISLEQLLAEQQKTNEKLDNLLNIFIKYDQEYNAEIVRDQGRTDLIS